MPSPSRIRPVIITAREQLAEGRKKLRQQHERGSPGIQVCAHLTDLIDTIVLDLYESALADLGHSEHEDLASEVALVPHGGYGRRDLAPYSDVDLMLLHSAHSAERIPPLARRISQDIYDLGLQLGFSVRTPKQAWQLALKDPVIFTSLVESRYLAGSVSLFTKYMSRFRNNAMRRSRGLIHAIDEARREERRKYGETVYLLTPNIKRSRGGLRDIQIIGWVAKRHFGDRSFRELVDHGFLTEAEYRILDAGQPQRLSHHGVGNGAYRFVSPGAGHSASRLAGLHGIHVVENRGGT